MVKTLDNTFTMNKDKVVASPVDVILDAVITKIEKGLLSEFLDPKVHDKFDNLEQETLLVHFETKFNERNFGGTDKIPYYDEPTTNSKLGKFIFKYDELKISQKIKVEYDSDGFSSIRLK